MTAMKAALDKQRQAWYGPLWEHVSWYGIPDADIPEPYRSDIIKYLHGKAVLRCIKGGKDD